jgi:hypothetical protein
MKRLPRIRSIAIRQAVKQSPHIKPFQAHRGLSTSSHSRQNDSQETYRPHYPRLNVPPAPRTPIQFRDKKQQPTKAPPPALHLHPNPTDSQIVHPKLQLVYDSDMMTAYPPSMLSFLQQYRTGTAPLSTPMPTAGLLERLRVANTAHPEGNTLHCVQLREQPSQDTVLAKLYRRAELVDMRNRLNKKLERRDVRPTRAKYLEFKWSVGRKEIVMRMASVPGWLAEGRTVTVTIARKRKWVEPNMRDAETLVRDVVRLFDEVAPAPVECKQEGQLGKVMVLEFKLRGAAAPDAVRVVDVPVPLRKPELVRKVVEVQERLRKWNVVAVRLGRNGAGLDGMPDVVDRVAVLAALRSVARTARDVRCTVDEGDEAGVTVVNMVPGDAEFSPRELEYRIPSDKDSRRNCADWTMAWLKEGKMVKLFVKRTNHDTEEAVTELARVVRLVLRSSGALKQKQLDFYVVDGTELYIPLRSRDAKDDDRTEEAISFPKYPGTVLNNNDIWGLVEFWNKHDQ